MALAMWRNHTHCRAHTERTASNVYGGRIGICIDIRIEEGKVNRCWPRVNHGQHAPHLEAIEELAEIDPVYCFPIRVEELERLRVHVSAERDDGRRNEITTALDVQTLNFRLGTATRWNLSPVGQHAEGGRRALFFPAPTTRKDIKADSPRPCACVAKHQVSRGGRALHDIAKLKRCFTQDLSARRANDDRNSKEFGLAVAIGPAHLHEQLVVQWLDALAKVKKLSRQLEARGQLRFFLRDEPQFGRAWRHDADAPPISGDVAYRQRDHVLHPRLHVCQLAARRRDRHEAAALRHRLDPPRADTRALPTALPPSSLLLS
eukprot:scaffold69933_cov25-Tisochrysis_lutea.AAC.1